MEVYGALSQPGTSDYEAPAGVQPSIEARRPHASGAPVAVHE